MPWQQPSRPRDKIYMLEPFRWPYWKFDGLEHEDLFGDLHDRFNTAPMAILDREAWHSDVVELLRSSDTVEEFHAQLEQRKTKRLNELKGAIDSVSSVGWGILPSQTLSRLGSALGCLYRGASIFHVVQVFLAMASVSHEDDQRRDRERDEHERCMRGEPKIPNTPSTDDNQRTEVSPDVATDFTERAPLQSPLTPSPSNDMSSPDSISTNAPARKRKSDDIYPEYERSTKRRATTPQSHHCEDAANRGVSRPAKHRRVSPSNITATDHLEMVGDIQDRAKGRDALDSHPHQSVEGAVATVQQDEAVPDQPQGNSALESRSPQTEQELPDVTEDADGKTISTLCSPDEIPPDHFDGLCETQYLPTDIDYAVLGWQRDYGPSDKALLGEEDQMRTAVASKICSDSSVYTLNS